ncbi:hypothetical protein Micbo1qcDRAFT_215454 [Microdochium bolleyi]|uniref:Effector 5 n=1 Tax=Microdochium bolleyi TaxID=196109 RepID=A0A136IS48_9PEZI|nr:hypothetical protein Micbo1qcDRAFT_215454 [Microdochium bolleyi]
MIANVALVLGLLGSASAFTIPNPTPKHALTSNHTLDEVNSEGGMSIQAFGCSSRPAGLNQKDCEYMSKIGMAGVGANSKSSSSKIWIGTNGPNKFTFKNSGSGGPVTLILWDFPPGDYEASFMNVRAPKISYSLPKPGDSVTVSIANGVSGAFAHLANHKTKLSQWGQIYNTWGEFTTGQWATVDVSRLVNTKGNGIAMKIENNGCKSHFTKCYFTCKDGGVSSCGESGTYKLVNCAPGSQPGATYGTLNGNPEGGCQGFPNGGKVTIDLKAQA